MAIFMVKTMKREYIYVRELMETKLAVVEPIGSVRVYTASNTHRVENLT